MPKAVREGLRNPIDRLSCYLPGHIGHTGRVVRRKAGHARKGLVSSLVKAAAPRISSVRSSKHLLNWASSLIFTDPRHLRCEVVPSKLLLLHGPPRASTSAVQPALSISTLATLFNQFAAAPAPAPATRIFESVSQSINLPTPLRPVRGFQNYKIKKEGQACLGHHPAPYFSWLVSSLPMPRYAHVFACACACEDDR